MIATTEERPLNFEHQPADEAPESQKPLLRDLHMSVTRNMWQTHGMMQSVKDAAYAALEAVSRFSQHMSGVAAEGPPAYPVDFHERLDRVERQLERERYAPRIINGGGDENNWKTVALIALALLQTITLGYLGYIQSTVMQTHDDVVTMKCKIDPQCRIVVTSVRP